MMKRREFIKNGIVLFAAPAIIKIENLMKLAVPREIVLVENKDLNFDDFAGNIIWQISKSLNVPYELLTRDYSSANYSASSFC